MSQKVLTIVGPTAVGKTALSIELAKRFNGEIISGDSMQIYKHLNIGTAKITTEEMANIRHHLLDFLMPHQNYSASMFQQMAYTTIDDIVKRKNLPIIVGGTGLYIEGLLEGMQFGGDDTFNKETRKYLEHRLETEGVHVLYEELQQKDSKAAEQIHPEHDRRIIRALEVLEHGDKFSEQMNVKKLDSFTIGLYTDREKLYQRINERVDIMIERGLLDEAKWLFEQDYPESTLSLKAIGYKELFPYFRGEASLEECVELLKRNSRRYAKRQLTWFRNRMSVRWFDVMVDSVDDLIVEIDVWLKK